MQQTISGEHRREGHPGQIHSLGEHLRSNQHVCLTGSEPIQQATMTVATSGGISIKPQQAQVLQLLRQLFHHPLGTGAEGLESSGAAMVATGPNLIAVITPVTAQPLTSTTPAMDGQGHVAMRTHHHFPAASTAKKRAVTATGHQHNRLLTLLRQRRQTLHQGTTDQTTMTLSQFMAHVDHMNRRQGLLGDALGQTPKPQRTLRMQLHPAVQRRGGTPQHDTGITAACPVQHQIAGVVAGHWKLLLVGTVVFFIEHHHPKRIKGHEHCRAGPHKQKGLIRFKAASPYLQPLTITTTAVVFENACPETSTAPIHKLRNQADFRRQHQHMPASLQLLSRKLHVDLCFARPRHTPEQQSTSGGQRSELSHHLLLFLCEGAGQLQALRCGAGLRRLIWRAAPLIPEDPSLVFESPQQCCTESLLFQCFLPKARTMGLQQLQNQTLSWRGIGCSG